VRRYKRFLVDVTPDDGPQQTGGGALVTAHCPNPGRLLGVAAPGSRVWLSRSPNPRRALPLTLEIVEADDGGALVGVNTMRPNRIVEEALRAGAIALLAGYGEIRREVPYGERSRVDLLLRRAGAPDCYVEVKNVHLRREGRAEFPDCVTARGARHLRELAALVGRGCRAVVVYVVQRADCAAFAPADDIDPAFAEAFRAAVAGGVEALCLSCAVGLDGIRLEKPLPIIL
jgi:sugar fermentation stimulation protein A